MGSRSESRGPRHGRTGGATQEATRRLLGYFLLGEAGDSLQCGCEPEPSGVAHNGSPSAREGRGCRPWQAPVLHHYRPPAVRIRRVFLAALERRRLPRFAVCIQDSPCFLISWKYSDGPRTGVCTTLAYRSSMLHILPAASTMTAERTRPTFSRADVTRYFDRITLPEEQRQYDVATLKPEDALAYLSLLVKYQLAAVPFENLTLHYSPYRQVSTHPKELFNKVVRDNNGRGGYCMENSTLFGTLLYSLNFNIYSAGARVFDGGKWTGWSHMINFVTIGDTKYHVDVGYGAEGPIVPMPLDRSGTVQTHIKPAVSRLQWRNIQDNTDPNQRLWVYEYRRDDASDWETKYAYTELEFLPQDYAIMNYFTSTSHRTFFTRVALAEKKILGDDGELVGNLIMMGNSLKWRIHGEKTKAIEFASEAERLEALEKYFGIKFGEVERDGIRGLASEIK